jgi:hypothetical protein
MAIISSLLLITAHHRAINLLIFLIFLISEKPFHHDLLGELKLTQMEVAILIVIKLQL